MSLEEIEKRRADFCNKQAASYDDPCFELFMWYPLPDESWALFTSRNVGKEFHINLWEKQVMPLMARAWGVDPHDLPEAIGDGSIPTGYVEFMGIRGRDVLALIVPDPMPEGWSVGRLKKELLCGDQIKQIHANERRGSDPVAIKRLIDTLRELRIYRSTNI